MVQSSGEPPLFRNPLSMAGAWLTTLSALAFLGYFVAESLDLFASPYAGILGFVVVPLFFVIGLALIPFGMWREGRRRKQGKAAWTWPVIDIGVRRTRTILSAVALLTVVNIGIVVLAGFSAAHYMESPTFCGQVCHEPMRPESTAHAAFPHANVGCVKCHVAPGARGAIRAKMNGTRQLYLLATGKYSRPIPVPAHGLPVAAETCENCHTPAMMMRDLVRTIREFSDDEANTELPPTTLVMQMRAIHWHARPDVRVEYIATDPVRETIPYVRVTAANGQVTEYFASTTAAAPAGELRRMDCLDCHTRPAHTFSATAERAVDAAIAAGELPQLPFVRRETLAAIKAEYPDEDTGAAEVGRKLRAFYASADPAKSGDVTRAVATAQRLYRVNVFPSMKITWGTYLSQLGHMQMTGCFRCHDEDHKTRDGKAISQDCALCHRDQ